MAENQIRREAGQSVEQIQSQLASMPRNRMYPKEDGSRSQEMLANIVQNSIEAMETCFPESEYEQERKQVNLSDPKEIRDTAVRYMTACSRVGVVPTFTGFCACLGFSRNRVYEILRGRKDKGTEMLSYVQSLFASIMEQGGLTRALDAANAIFALKNSGQNFADRVDISATAGRAEPFQNGDPEEIARRYLAGVAPATIENEVVIREV